MKNGISKFLDTVNKVSPIFWILGFALGLLELFNWMEFSPWTNYIALVFIFPLLVALTAFKRVEIQPFFLGLFVALGLLRLVATSSFELVLLSFGFSWWLIYQYRVLDLVKRREIFLLSWMGCYCAKKLLWWGPEWSQWLNQDSLSIWIAGFFALTGLLCVSPRIQINIGKRFSQWALYCVYFCTLLVLGLASSRVGFFEDGDFYVGTIRLLRGGGWLLWDTPSQYGFLNLLLASLIPVKNSYVALYLFNSTLLFLVSAAVFALGCICFPGLLGAIFSGLLAFNTVHLSGGWIPILRGVNANPSVSAMRFIWCYVLCAVVCFFLARAAKSSKDSFEFKTSDPGKRILQFGDFAWLLSTLWSFETAFFSTCIWFSFLLAIQVPWKNFGKLVLAYLGTWIIISIYYLIFLGHLPDYFSFLEYVIQYQGGFGAYPLQKDGPILVLILIFIYGIYLSSVQARKGKIFFPISVVVTALMGSVGSYFVTRSHPNCISNLLPLISFCLFMLIYGMRLEKDKSQITPLLSVVPLTLLIPIYVVSGITTWGNSTAIGGYLNSLLAERSGVTIGRTTPLVPPQIYRLLESASVPFTDAIVDSNNVLLYDSQTESFANAWLPLSPGSQIGLLPIDRQKQYLERFLQRRVEHAGGWLLFQSSWEAVSQPTLRQFDNIYPTPAFLRSALVKTHVRKERFEKYGWVLEKYQRF